MASSVPPNIKQTDPPPLHEMGEVMFEEMCAALHAQEPDVATCDRFGTKGQGQFGVDLLARRRNNDGIELGQCKCHRSFTSGQIKTASDEFLAHWDGRWKDRDVRRFILFVACDLSKTDRQERIDAERKRFAALGVVYEAWSARSITHKLSSAPGIVARCLGSDYWFERIVGQKMLTFAGAATGGPTPLAVQQIEALRPLAQAGVARDLDDARALSRKGREREAIARLDALQSDSVAWAVIDSRERARALRLRAGILLREGTSLAEARRLANEAEILDPASALRLKALIVDREAGPEAGLAILGAEEREEIAQVRAAFLMRLGRAPEALSLLDPLQDEGPDAAETRRLRALARLLTGDREGAERDARDGVRLATEERLTRHTLAVVLYCRALSTAVPLANLVAWPDPLDWTLVRRDDEAIEKLNEAEEIFAGLLRLEAPESERLELQGWRLACLANVPARRAEAEVYCRALFKADPTQPAAVAWALARNLPFRAGSTRKALRDLLAAGRGEIRHVLAFVALLLSAKHYRQAREWLDREKGRFVAAGGELLWRLWSAQANALGAAQVGTITNDLPDEHLAVLAASIDNDQERGERRLAELATASAAPGGNPLVLLDCMERLAQRQRWALVAPHAMRLVGLIGTAETVRLAAYALAETQHDADAVQLLTEHELAFPSGVLSGDLRRLRVQCNVNAGHVVEAIREAEEISQGSSSADDIVGLAELHLMKGDVRSASKVVRSFKQRAEMTAAQSLRLSQHLLLDDPDLSRELWRQATSAGLDDRLLPNAYILAHRLGLERDLATVTERMTALASSGKTTAVISASLDDVVSMVRERRETAERMEELYRTGTIPVHLLSKATGVPLADRYHFRLEVRASDRTWRGGYLLAHHGGRRPAEKFPQSPSELRLHLDVTAILLAEHLGILGAVEGRFRPLRIPVDLTPALLEMRDGIAPMQRDRINAHRVIVRLCEQGRIATIDTPQSEAPRRPDVTDDAARWLAQRATEGGGVVVAFNDPDPSVPAALAERFSNCRGFLEALRTAGPLSALQHDEALKSFGTEGQRAARLAPAESGTPTYFHGGTIDIFALAGLLDIVCNRFSVYIEASELDSARAQIAAADQADRLVVWLSALIDRIQRGVDAGVYLHIPRAGHLDVEHVEDLNDHGFQSILSLLSISPEAGNVLWFDDRALTAYVNANGTAIVGVNDILKALRSYGAITVDEHFQCLLKMRAAHVRYVPMEQGELIYHLRAAPVEDGSIVETQELGIIRRYFSASLLQDDILQLPPVPNGAPNKEGEIWFVVSCQRAIHDAILEVWRDDDATPVERIARANWIRRRLDVDRYRLIPAPNRQEVDRQRVLVAHLAALVMQGIYLIRPFRNVDDARIDDYMTWLDGEVLQSRLTEDPELSPPIGEMLRALLITDRLSESDPEALRILWRSVARRVIRAMPEPVRSAVLDDVRTRETLDVRIDAIVGLGDREFREREFWQAAADAVANGSSTVTAIDKTELAIKVETAIEEEGPTLVFEHAGDEKYRVADPLHALLQSDAAPVRRVLQSHREWLDLPGKEFERAIAELVAIPDPADRVAAVMRRRGGSAAYFYLALGANIRQGKPIARREMLPPSAEALRRHFRFHADDARPLSDRLADSVVTLIADEGLDQAFERLSGLPVPLPPALLAVLQGLGPEEAAAALQRWKSLSLSPVAHCHLLRAAAHVRATCGISIDTVAILDELVAAVQQDGTVDAFLVLLQESAMWLRELPGWEAYPPAERLALTWAHASRIFHIYRSVGAKSAWITETFKGEHQGGELSFRAPCWAWLDDVAAPEVLGRGQFVLRGLWYALGSDAAEQLGPARLDALRTLGVQRVSDRDRPVLEFLRDPALAGDLLGSFLAHAPDAMLLALIGPDAAEWYSSAHLETFLSNAVDRCVTSEAVPKDWLGIELVAGDRRVYPRIRPLMNDALTRANLVSLHKNPGDLWIAIGRFAMRQASRSEDERVRAAMANHLVALARNLAEVNPAPPPISETQTLRPPFRDAFFLLELAISLNRTESDAEANAERFAALARRIGEAWPACRPVIESVMAQLAQRLPYTITGPLWREVLELRAVN